MSTIKSLVKTCREAIDRQDYSTSLRLCETGLAIESDNYMLLVFQAISLQNLDQKEKAILSYKNAAQIQPLQPLAWQGMATLLEEMARGTDNEKSSNEWLRVIDPLERLKSLTIQDLEKQIAYTQRLLEAYERAGKLLACCPLLRELRQENVLHMHEITKIQLLDKEIMIGELMDDQEIKKKVETERYRLGADPLPLLREKSINEIYSKSNIDQLMLERIQLERNVKMADRLLDRWQRKIPLLSTESRLEKTNTLIELAQQYKDDSNVARDLLFEFKDWPNILDIEGDCNKKDQNVSLFELLLSLKRAWENDDKNDGEDAGKDDGENDRIDRNDNLKLIEKLLKRANERIDLLKVSFGWQLPSLKRQLERFKGILLTKMGNYEHAIAILVEFLPDRQIILYLLTCYKETKQYQKAINLYEQMGDSESEIGWLHYLSGDYKLALQALKEAEKQERSAITLCRLGIVLWHMDEHNRIDRDCCFKYFIEACKIDSSLYEPFLYLGKYYQKIELDLKRAEKCLVKTVNLQGDCLEAVLDLSTLWIEQTSNDKTLNIVEQLQKVIRLLEPFKDDNPCNTRLWTCLGICLVGIHDYHKGTLAFQMAIKNADSLDSELRCLFGIADGYRKQEKFGAAVKVYERALSLCPGNVTAIFGLATVLSDQTEYKLARVEFKRLIINLSKQNEQPINLSEQAMMNNLIDFAKYKAIRCAYEDGCNSIKFGCILEAIEVMGEALIEILDLLNSKKSLSRLSNFLKLLSDMTVLILQVVDIPESDTLKEKLGEILEFMGPEFRDNEIWKEILDTLSMKMINNTPSITELVIKISILCQLKIIMETGQDNDDVNIDETISCAWTDLSFILLHTLYNNNHNNNNSNVLQLCLDFAKQATSNDACSSGIAWLMRGAVHVKLSQFGMAQHCLIKAINRQVPEGWISLACLYNQIGKVDLARKALEKIHMNADNSDSNYYRALAWFYDALIDRLDNEDESSFGRIDEKVNLASELLESSCPLSMIEVYHVRLLRMLQQKNHPVSTNPLSKRLLQCATKVIAMNPNDKIAKTIITNKNQNIIHRPNIIQELAIAIKHSSSSNDQDMLKALSLQLDEYMKESKLYINDAIWLKAYIHYHLNDPSLTITILLDHLQSVSLQSDQTWEDLLYWGKKLLSLQKEENGKEEEDQEAISNSITTMIRDWLRLVINLDISITSSPIAAQTIVFFWNEKMPPEIGRNLNRIIKFDQDIKSRKLLA